MKFADAVKDYELRHGGAAGAQGVDGSQGAAGDGLPGGPVGASGPRGAGLSVLGAALGRSLPATTLVRTASAAEGGGANLGSEEMGPEAPGRVGDGTACARDRYCEGANCASGVDVADDGIGVGAASRGLPAAKSKGARGKGRPTVPSLDGENAAGGVSMGAGSRVPTGAVITKPAAGMKPRAAGRASTGPFVGTGKGHRVDGASSADTAANGSHTGQGGVPGQPAGTEDVARSMGAFDAAFLAHGTLAGAPSAVEPTQEAHMWCDDGGADPTWYPGLDDVALLDGMPAGLFGDNNDDAVPDMASLGDVPDAELGVGHEGAACSTRQGHRGEGDGCQSTEGASQSCLIMGLLDPETSGRYEGGGEDLARQPGKGQCMPRSRGAAMQPASERRKTEGTARWVPVLI
eukprot:jgi/Mesvir1/23830/Mv10635-RA.1